jgi:hypothetical protein
MEIWLEKPKDGADPDLMKDLTAVCILILFKNRKKS